MAAESPKISWETIVLALVAVAAIVACAWLWLHPRTATVTRTEYRQVPVEKRVESIRTVTVPGPKQIVTIEKQAVAEKLQLPALVTNDPDQEVVADAEIPASEGGTSAVVVMQAHPDQPATFRVIAKELPPPLIAIENHGDTGLRYGIGTGASAMRPYTGEVYGRWSFLRIGPVHLGVYGAVDTSADARIMADLSYRW